MNLLSLAPMFLRVSETVCAALWRASWQGVVAVFVIAALCRFFPQLSANARCWMWRMAMVKFVLTLLLPAALPLHILPTAAPAIRPLAAPAVTIAAPTEKVGQVLPIEASATASPAPEVQAATPVPAQALPTGYEAHPATAAVQTISTTESAAPPTPAASTIVSRRALLFGSLFALYVLGVAVCALRLIANVARTARFLRLNCRPCGDARAIEDFATLANRIGWRGPVRLVEASGVASSQLIAGLPPLLLLPTETADNEARRLMLAHELAHLRRRDLVWATLSALTHTLFFFHPAVWLARREEELAREIACDALAVAATRTSPARYGALLVEIVTQGRSGGISSTRAAASLGIADGVAQIGRRLIALRSIGTPVAARRLRLLLAVSTVAALFALVPYRLVAARVRQVHPPRAMMPPNADASASLSGRIVYGKPKTPSTSASVWIRPLPDSPAENDFRRKRVQVDADGRFQFPNLSPGRYKIRAGDDGGAWQTDDRDGNSTFTLKSREQRMLPDLALKPQVQVIGSVVDVRTGQPVTDVEVMGGSADRDGQYDAGRAGYDSHGDWYQVGGNGQFKVYVPAGNAALYARNRRNESGIYTGRKWTSEYGVPSSAGVVKTVFTARSDHPLHLDLKVAAAAVSPLVTVLPPLTGKVIAPGGRTVAGAEVFLFGGDHLNDIAPIVRTDANGRFKFVNLDARWRGPTVMLRARSIERGLMSHPIAVPIPLTGAAPQLSVPLVAHLASSVAGRVVDGAGRGISYATVDLLSWGSDASVQDHTLADADGRYRFDGLWPDLLTRTEATKAGFGARPDAEGGIGADFPLATGKQRQVNPIILDPADRQVAGRLVDRHGVSIPNVGVSAVRGPSILAHATTDREGAFHMGHLSAGPLRLYFENGVARRVEGNAGDTNLRIVGE